IQACGRAALRMPGLAQLRPPAARFAAVLADCAESSARSRSGAATLPPEPHEPRGCAAARLQPLQRQRRESSRRVNRRARLHHRREDQPAGAIQKTAVRLGSTDSPVAERVRSALSDWKNDRPDSSRLPTTTTAGGAAEPRAEVTLG